MSPDENQQPTNNENTKGATNMMKSYTAWCTSYEGEKMNMTRECESKKEFAQLLHDNGYKVSFIALTENYEEECEKYHARLERKRRESAIRRECERQWRERDKKFAEELEKRLAAEEEATEEAAQEDETMKRRYFYIPDIDSTMCVEISTKKEMIDLLDETIRFNCTDEECIFDIIYKDGSEIRIDENNRKYKKSGIAAIVNDNGTTVQVYGAFEINENGVVYPALTEKIDENLIEVDDWNYHAPTEEEIENVIAEEVEKEYFGETSAAVPNLYRNELDNAPEVREMLRSCSHIQFDWRRNHAVFYKCESEIGRAYNIDNMDLQKVARSLGKSYDRTW